jgi:hypothetical protein
MARGTVGTHGTEYFTWQKIILFSILLLQAAQTETAEKVFLSDYRK